MRWNVIGLMLALAAGASTRAAERELETPRRALRAFIDSARAGDFAAAARVLDLPEARRGSEGPRLARQLKFVLDQQLWLDWDRISDEPDGDPVDGSGADVVGNVPLGSAQVPIRVVRTGGVWRIGPGVVAAIPSLYAVHGPGWIGERLPPVLTQVRFLEVQAWQWIGLAAAVALAVVVAFAFGAAARRIALRLTRHTSFEWDDLLVDAASGPARLLLGIATFAGTARMLSLAVPAQQAIGQFLRIAVISLFSWAGLRALRFGAEVLAGRMSLGAADGAARARLTQIMVLKRIVGFVVIVVGGALVLLQFEALRAVGTSLLASAGVAGIVVGLAAQRSIATLLAGLQISLTQPVRVGDVVVIEGEWGTIEEITLTYVVVRIWDLRRLVVPITRILDAPFQNWTRSGSEILGTVLLHADYRLPVDEVRGELERFVATRPEWDGKVVGLQVTNATERAVELRALVSSADASRSWDLRCAVREHLLAFVQRLEGGAYLPRARIESSGLRPLRNVVADTAAVSPTSSANREGEDREGATLA
jgi:small-conductance mechanosensitive channel